MQTLLHSLEVGLVTWANSAFSLGFQETYKPKLRPSLPPSRSISSETEMTGLVAKAVQGAKDLKGFHLFSHLFG